MLYYKIEYKNGNISYLPMSSVALTNSKENGIVIWSVHTELCFFNITDISLADEADLIRVFKNSKL